MIDYIELGSTPADEPWVQVSSTEDYLEAMTAECRRYKALLEEIFADRPEGLVLALKRFSHDFGSYLEVVAKYDTDDEEAEEYAWGMEERLPAHW